MNKQFNSISILAGLALSGIYHSGLSFAPVRRKEPAPPLVPHLQELEEQAKAKVIAEAETRRQKKREKRLRLAQKRKR